MDYWNPVRPVWDTISIYDGGERFVADYEAAPEDSRVLFAAHWCQSEICNGGFHQFYGNSTGVLAPEALDAFHKLGMPKTAELIAKSIAWFDTPFPRDRAVRQSLLDAHAEANVEAPDPFDALDDPFFKTLESEAGGFEAAANSFADAWQSETVRR
ncbi:DMP19 family protein [Kinneretia aquatilis]|uniref:DMP19 family protein n=1 Tax=Kinneretia aquatilis TaxID=2070761 RepID=UPI0014953739|nr:DUF4375 domain-containing protein [Paucibacter aquatile]WIV98338.1 DUF4375 domain-containing protein [Paucibacter aquatile]